MNLFIETPQRASERLAREYRSRDAWLEAMHQQYAAQQMHDEANSEVHRGGDASRARDVQTYDDEAARSAAQASLDEVSGESGSQIFGVGASGLWTRFRARTSERQAFAGDDAHDAAMDASSTGVMRSRGDAQYDSDAAARDAADGQTRVKRRVRDEDARYPSDDGYSVAQASYHDELVFQKRRARRRRLATLLRTLALIILIPVLLVGVFIGSYVFTCILNGATPQEVGELLRNMVSRVEGFILSLSS